LGRAGYELDYNSVKLNAREVYPLVIQGLLKEIDTFIIATDKYPLSEDRTLKNEEKDQLAWYLRNI